MSSPRVVPFSPAEPAREPWDRRPRESAKAYAAFCLYRDLGPSARSLTRVAQESHKSRPLIARWCRRWSWVRRVEGYDLVQERQRREALEEEHKEMLRRYRMLEHDLYEKVVQRLRGDPAEGIPSLNPATLDAHDLAKLIDIAIKAGRVGLEMPDQTHAHKGDMNVPGLADFLATALPGETIGGTDKLA